MIWLVNLALIKNQWVSSHFVAGEETWEVLLTYDVKAQEPEGKEEKNLCCFIFPKNVKTFKLGMTFECQQMYPELQSVRRQNTNCLAFAESLALPDLQGCTALGLLELACVIAKASFLSHGCTPDQKMWIQASCFGLCNAASRDRTSGSVSPLHGHHQLSSTLCTCSVLKGGCSFSASVYRCQCGAYSRPWGLGSVQTEDV